MKETQPLPSGKSKYSQIQGGTGLSAIGQGTNYQLLQAGKVEFSKG